MTEDTKTAVELADVSKEALGELTRRVENINHSYMAVAEKVGQLYMFADEQKVSSLTFSLDKPMRNASDNQQMFAAILEDLKMAGNRHQ